MNKEVKDFKRSGLTRAGLILNVIGASILGIIFFINIFTTLASVAKNSYSTGVIILGILISLAAFGVQLASLIVSAMALRSKTRNIIAAGVLGIFSGLLGGILTLVGNSVDQDNYDRDNHNDAEDNN